MLSEIFFSQGNYKILILILKSAFLATKGKEELFIQLIQDSFLNGTYAEGQCSMWPSPTKAAAMEVTSCRVQLALCRAARAHPSQQAVSGHWKQLPRPAGFWSIRLAMPGARQLRDRENASPGHLPEDGHGLRPGCQLTAGHRAGGWQELELTQTQPRATAHDWHTAPGASPLFTSCAHQALGEKPSGQRRSQTPQHLLLGKIPHF